MRQWLASTSLKDWAELLRAIAWPIVALIIFWRLHGVLEQLLLRLTQAEGMGFKLRLDKLGKELPKAEAEAKKVKPRLPDVPKPSSNQ